MSRVQDRENMPSGAERIRQAARRKPKEKRTALLHHLTPETLGAAYDALKREAAPGVDGMSWEEYGQGRDERLRDLHERVHRGAYRAKPVRRVNIPKPDGGKRPLGVAALEDKILQRAMVDNILTPIYETEFIGFSYGFRPGRGAHDALDALAYGIMRRKINWIVDADIRQYFDRIDREWMIRFLEVRIGDRRVLRLIQKWLNAGVMEAGKQTDSGQGTPQGAVVSPVLANVYRNEHLPTARGAAGVDSEEAAGEIPTVGHTVHPGQGRADGGDASGIADLRGGPASGAICLQGRPQRAGRSPARASAGEQRTSGSSGRRFSELFRRNPAL